MHPTIHYNHETCRESNAHLNEGDACTTLVRLTLMAEVQHTALLTMYQTPLVPQQSKLVEDIEITTTSLLQKKKKNIRNDEEIQGEINALILA